MKTQSSKAETKDSVLTENTAQAVFKYLIDQESNRASMHTRWIWELLQNARDASTADNNGLIAEIKYSPGELVFLHNGRGFKQKEIAHLIFHGSTKVEEEESIGRYGSGFLTTHLLSSEIGISGRLDDGQWFDFLLERKPDSVGALRESMDEAWENFNPSSSAQMSIPDFFTTRFRYPIVGHDAADTVTKGIETLKQCAPFVVVFNPEFSRIDIKIPCETMCFEVVERRCLDVPGIQQITVVESTNENCTEMKYILAQGEIALVTVPLKSDGDDWVCQPIGKTPRLFLGFPLVGTESFSFPAIINSFKFAPTENRDGVYLGQSTNDANIVNQAVIEESCGLLARLLQFAASKGWNQTHWWAEVPAIQDKDWLRTEWLRERITQKLIEEIRKTPAVLTEAGNAIPPNKAMLPVAESAEGATDLWDLLESWQGYREKLPRREETAGWYNVIKSWTRVSGREVSAFDEAIDGRKLALYVEEKTKNAEGWGHLKNLQNLLQENVCAVNWLNRLYGFLRDNGFDDVIRNRRFVPNQEGWFRGLSSLYRDLGIHEELKDIAKLLGERIRWHLRNPLLFSLAQEAGAGDRDIKYVVENLINSLQKRVRQNSDDNFKKASTRLFAWIVAQKDYSRLRGFPVFTEDGKSDSLSVLYLPSAAHGGEPPLAPVCAWPGDLKPFSDLFPPSRIVADAFFQTVPNQDTWRVLNEQNLIRTDMIIRRNDKVNLKAFSPEVDRDEGVHNTRVSIPVTDVVNRVEIMERVSNRQERALLFWRFLTEWLINEDVQGLENAEVACECGDTHKYYPAAWLIPVRNNSWIRVEGSNGRVRASALSLASLFRDNGWEPGSLNRNPDAVKLLKAIDVSQFDLLREFAAENDEERTRQDAILAEILLAPQGDLSQIRALVRDVQEDEHLLLHLEERRKRRGIMHENQRLGQQVEEWVREHLEREGFLVLRTGTGSDFEISEDTEDLLTLDITQDDRSWLVEVKSTRTEGGRQSVRLTSTQAQTVVKKKEKFLLCVVPLGQENTTSETVRENMRFIKNIGHRVAPLCEALDSLEKLREEITANASSGVKLVCEAGTTGILVNKSVWEAEGFPLEKLAEHLK